MDIESLKVRFKLKIDLTQYPNDAVDDSEVIDQSQMSETWIHLRLDLRVCHLNLPQVRRRWRVLGSKM